MDLVTVLCRFYLNEHLSLVWIQMVKKFFRIKLPGAYFWIEKTKAKKLFSEKSQKAILNTGTNGLREHEFSFG